MTPGFIAAVLEGFEETLDHVLIRLSEGDFKPRSGGVERAYRRQAATVGSDGRLGAGRNLWMNSIPQLTPAGGNCFGEALLIGGSPQRVYQQ